MIPQLPTNAVRRAILASDWAGAERLLREHHQCVEEALAAGVHVDHAEAWDALVLQQRTMAGELQAARDETFRLLQDLSRQRRGARAYRTGVAA